MPESPFVVENEIESWLEELSKQLIAVGLSVFWITELIPLIPCTFFNTDDVSCLISEAWVTMLIALSQLSGLKFCFLSRNYHILFSNLSQNVDVATKRLLCSLPLRSLVMSLPVAACCLSKQLYLCLTLLKLPRELWAICKKLLDLGLTNFVAWPYKLYHFFWSLWAISLKNIHPLGHDKMILCLANILWICHEQRILFALKIFIS